MLSITEIEQINQKLNPELALSLSLDNAKRMESSLLHSGFSPSTDMWKLILFYNGSLEEIKEMISFSFIPLLGNFAILFIKEKDIPSFLTFPQVLYVELSRPIYENALTGIDASCFPDYNIVTGRNVNATTLTGKGTAIAVLDSGVITGILIFEMWMEVRGFWLIGIRVCLLLLLIKKILIAIVLIVITSNTLVQQIVKTIISQQTIELTPEGIMFPSIAPL